MPQFRRLEDDIAETAREGNYGSPRQRNHETHVHTHTLYKIPLNNYHIYCRYISYRYNGNSINLLVFLIVALYYFDIWNFFCYILRIKFKRQHLWHDRIQVAAYKATYIYYDIYNLCKNRERVYIVLKLCTLFPGSYSVYYIKLPIYLQGEHIVPVVHWCTGMSAPLKASIVLCICGRRIMKECSLEGINRKQISIFLI